MHVTDLGAYGFPQTLIDMWAGLGIRDLTDIQATAFRHRPLLESQKNTIIVAPTSAGKTFVGEALGALRAMRMQRSVYLVPYKALAEEKYWTLRETYGRQMGMSIVVSSGDRTEFDTDIRRGNFSIAVMVYEKFAHLLLAHPGLLQNVSLLVVDEIQMVGDPYRGPRLELVLTKVLLSQRQPQILALSATVDNLTGLDEWLEADVLTSSVRPVPLFEGAVNLEGAFEYHDPVSGQRMTENLGFPRAAHDGGDLLALLVEHYCKQGKQVLIFRSTKAKTETTARALKTTFSPVALHATTSEQLSLLEETDVRSYLEDGLGRGVAYHNADLSMDERALVEYEFRQRRISVLVSTTTLAAGVNLPADIVLIPDLTRWTPATGERAIPVSEYKNMAGRAGRLSLKSEGRAMLLAVGGIYTTDAVFGAYIHGQVEAIESAIPRERDFSIHVLNLVASGLARNEGEVVQVFGKSFAYHSFYRHKGGLGQSPREAIAKLLRLNLVTDTQGQLAASELGKIVASSGVTTEGFEGLMGFLRTAAPEHVGIHELLYDVCSLGEVANLAPYLARDERIGNKFRSVLPAPGEIYASSSLRRILESPYVPGEAENGVLQKVVLLEQWRQGASARSLSRAFRVGLGPVRDLGEKVAWLLETLEACAKVVGFPEGFRAELLAIGDELHFGVPREAVKFARLRVRGISRDQVIRLVKNERGIVFESYDQILDTPVEEFRGVVNPAVAQRLKEAILASAGDRLRRTLQGQLARLEANGLSTAKLQGSYADVGTELERTLESLLRTAPLNLECVRIGTQNRAEADLHLEHADGLIVVQVTASEDGAKPISWDKSREILGAAAGRAPVSYIVIGRPDFHELARQHAETMRTEPGRPLLLMPLSVLMEAYVLVLERRIDAARLLQFLREERGYVDIERLYRTLGLELA